MRWVLWQRTSCEFRAVVGLVGLLGYAGPETCQFDDGAETIGKSDNQCGGVTMPTATVPMRWPINQSLTGVPIGDCADQCVIGNAVAGRVAPAGSPTRHRQVLLPDGSVDAIAVPQLSQDARALRTDACALDKVRPKSAAFGKAAPVSRRHGFYI
jgi:hypothetical protein